MNIILIVSDTFRRDHLGCYGNKWISTPNLDKFAKESIIFDQAYAASFPTVPNRMDIMTGRFSFVQYEWQPLPRDEVVLSEILGEAGYVTMLIADTPHILEDGYNFDRGFTGWKWIRGQEAERYMTDPIEVKLPCAPHKLRNPEGVKKYLRNVSLRQSEADYFVARTMIEAAKWLERNYKQEKFFLYVDTFDPHEPWDPPRWYVDRYDPNYEGEEVIYPVYGPADYLTKEELRHMRALYAGEVTMVDRWIGMLLRKVEDLGLFDNTAVIFTTDHGFYLGEHNLTGKSIITSEFHANAPLYEEVTHIPLLIRLPGQTKRGVHCSALVQPPDLTATIIELAGVEDPGTLQGRSILPLLKGERCRWRDIAITSPTLIHGRAGATRPTITDGEYSFIYVGFSPSEPEEKHKTRAVDGILRGLKSLGKVENELYHLPSDPQQRHNIFSERKDVAKRLHSRFVEFLREVGISEERLRYWLKI